MSFEVILLALLPSILYAFAGAITAHNNGDKINYALFSKTIALGLIAAGVMSQSTGDTMIAFTASGTFTYLVDKIINSVLVNRNLIKP